MFFCYGRTWGTSLHFRMFSDTPGVRPYIQDFIGVEIHGCINPWVYDSMGIQKGEGIQSLSDVKPGIAKRLNYNCKERINALSMKSVCGGTDRGGSLVYLSIPT